MFIVMTFSIVFVVLAIVSVWCQTLLEGNCWGFMNDPWANKEPCPPVTIWPQQFISDFYLGAMEKTKRAIIYDWTKTVISE